MHWKCLLLTVLGVSHEVSAAFHQEAPLLPTPSVDYCAGTRNDSKSDNYTCGDTRLGPKVLPKQRTIGEITYDYHPFGNNYTTPGVFLTKWTNREGAYKYPVLNGFQLDINGVPILGNMTLTVGTIVDRFGSEYGQYVSAADAPFSQRSLPPSSLETHGDETKYPADYHIYNVSKPFTVIGGPIAPWFGQPGLGAQYFLGAAETIVSLKGKKYLVDVDL